MVLDQLTAIIFIMGIATVLLSVVVAVRFYVFQKYLDNSARDLTQAIAWQLAGEAVIGFGTLIFAWATHFGIIETWSQPTKSMIRFVMFFATSATTYHLLRTLRQLSQVR